MSLPGPISEFIDTFREPWKPISAAGTISWAIFFALFLLFLFNTRGAMTMLDNLYLPIHEGGHIFFGMFGSDELMVWGGTLMQLLVPFLLALTFAYRREPYGTAFCSFLLFQSLRNVAVYMADARAMALQLVTVGGGDDVEHDWNHIFGHLGVFQHDAQIAALVNAIGWIGLIAVPLWLGWRWKGQERGLAASAR